VIRQLSGRADIEAAYPVMSQLRPHLSLQQYLAAVERMQGEGFLMAGVTVGDQVVAVAGYRFGESLAHGRYCYVDDLVTSDAARSRGYGKLLMDWLKGAARAAGCRTLQLDSGVQRHGAHRFYLRERMDISSYHFGISLM
jgi:GNAT superfamily N-acetyltransferase